MSGTTHDVAISDDWVGNSYASEVHLELLPFQPILERVLENVHVENPILDEVQVNDHVSHERHSPSGHGVYKGPYGNPAPSNVVDYKPADYVASNTIYSYADTCVERVAIHESS
jgi:hypothetical protein